MKTVKIVVLLMIILFINLPSFKYLLADDMDVLTAYALNKPTIDGIISTLEWVDADSKVFYLGPSNDHKATLYVKNDLDNLYLAFNIEGVTYGPDGPACDVFTIWFDNDDDGVLYENGDDILTLSTYAIPWPDYIPRLSDLFVRTDTGSFGYDEGFGGSNDGEGYWTHTNPTPNANGDYIFELLHPLNSDDDAHDFSLVPGDEIGFYIYFSEGIYITVDPWLTTVDWSDEWPEDKHGHIIIAHAEAQSSLSSINERVMLADFGKAYFIFADPFRMSEPVAAYDVVAGGILFGVCANEQNLGFDSNDAWIVPSGGDKGRVLLSDAVVLLFGGPFPCWAVKYYEDSGLSPAKFHSDANNLYFITQQGDILASLPTGTDFSHNDLFLVEAFTDANGNTVYVIYGFSWRGTWAGGIYFHDVIFPNINDYVYSYYIFRWTDLNNDSTPQADEIEEVVSG